MQLSLNFVKIILVKVIYFRLLKLQQRIFVASMAVFHFTCNSWEFKDDMMMWLREEIHPADKNEFGIDGIEYTDEKQFLIAAIKGASVYLLKEPEDKTQARRHCRR
jgi:hypothetical protein